MAVRNFKTSSIKTGTQRTTIWDQSAGGIPVSGYNLWLDAGDVSTITLSGSAVTQWNDKSFNAYQFTQSNSSYRPTSGITTINNRNVLDFDNVDSLIANTSAATWTFLSDATKSTIFMVLKRNATSNGTNALLNTNNAGSSSVRGMTLTINDGDNYPSAFCGNGNGGQYVYRLRDTATTAIGTNTTVLSYSLDASNATEANKVKAYVNTGSAIGGNTDGAGLSTDSPNNPLYIGDFVAGTGIGLKGKFAEIIIYPSELTTTDRNKVRDYLIGKWGI